MSIFSKKGNSDKIALQNIVLGINEKKLEVSEEFLMNMTKVYVSKRMKKINDEISGFEQVPKVALFFKKQANVSRLLDELIALEPYYLYNLPRPSEYKLELEDNTENYVLKIINRNWSYIRYDPNSKIVSPDIIAYFSDAKSVWDKLPDSAKKTLDELHTRVYGRGVMEEEKPDVPLVSPEETKEEAEKNSEGQEQNEEPIPEQEASESK